MRARCSGLASADRQVRFRQSSDLCGCVLPVYSSKSEYMELDVFATKMYGIYMLLQV